MKTSNIMLPKREELREEFKTARGYKYLRVKTIGLNTIQYIEWLELNLLAERMEKVVNETVSFELTDDDHRTFVGDPLRDMISDAMDNLAVAFVNPGSVDIADHVNALHEKLKEYNGTNRNETKI